MPAPASPPSQFQRSPAGAGTWTNQAASWNTTLQADGQYDLRVVTTDNAGNSFTSGAITIRVDNTDPTGSITAPPNGAEIGIPPVALTSNSADRLSAAQPGVATVVFERSPAGAGSWTATPAGWNTASGPNAVADGDVRPAREDDRQRRQLVHVRGDHGPGRPHGADDLRLARAGIARATRR